MDAARPRNRTSGGRVPGESASAERLAGPRRRRAALFTALPVAAADGVLWACSAPTFAALPTAYWLMAALAVVVDARPYVLAGRRASSVILPSICFTFAIALAWGFAAALAVQLVAVTVAGMRMRQAARRTLHLALQHAVAIGAAAVVAALASLRIAPEPDWDDALLTVAAASAWILARYGLAAIVARLGSHRRHGPARRRSIEVLATAALLLLGPVVLATAQVGLAFVPLVLLALHAVHRMVRSVGEYERAARVDSLTGLPNRRALNASVSEPGTGRALLLLDLDRFRTVNDALGHSVGDRLLIEVARRLAAVVPAHDLVVRLGGDEFAVLATRVDGAPEARRIACHLAEALNRPFALDGTPIDVTASIGIALQHGPAADSATLLRQAEAAMYDAKQRGDQVAVYGPDAAHHSPDRLTLLADLRRALREDAADDGIVLFYQPQIAIATGEVVGVEALLRWQHPERGLVGPEELIRVAELTPVMRLLTGRVLHDVVAQLAVWRDAGRPLRAAVNVSARDLHAGDIADRVEALLRDHGVPADLLQLEITESALMADPHRVLNTITRLDRMGVAISLDDFGTGYSSLQHLRRLPLAEVKIDRSFVLGMSTDRGDAAIVRSVIDLAEALGLRAVAEGVEDERTWRLLAASGCHAAQGWFHARPMPTAELATWLSRYRPVRPGPAPMALPLP
ncbi:putative bifunctional diguanylate cyclase/phosphodiesterase [Paractinoplanes rishiriensis]|uniref:GGDEF-domain containing protein n=1 Tax=Paractinoplanes rishiriensis TaxID=1050105 RepID=A0A919MSJ2_9ACTN|nr:GGDEF-domain containing protein [Actinoplanes rishiriensis]